LDRAPDPGSGRFSAWLAEKFKNTTETFPFTFQIQISKRNVTSAPQKSKKKCREVRRFFLSLGLFLLGGHIAW
jgi:hypothetical protein